MARPKVGHPLFTFPHTLTLGPAHWDPAHAAKRQARSLNKQQDNSHCPLGPWGHQALLLPTITVTITITITIAVTITVTIAITILGYTILFHTIPYYTIAYYTVLC